MLPADIYGERCAVDICFSYANVNVFVVAYNRPTWVSAWSTYSDIMHTKENQLQAEKDTMLREKGLLCLWDAKVIEFEA